MGRPTVGPSLAAAADMRCGSAVGFVVCGMAALGCSDGSGPADDTGSIEVTVAMNGAALDPGGFDVLVDGEKAGTMAGVPFDMKRFSYGGFEVMVDV